MAKRKNTRKTKEQKEPVEKVKEPTIQPVDDSSLPTKDRDSILIKAGIPVKPRYRIDELAYYFDVSEGTIRNYIDHKRFKVEQYVPNGIKRVPKESLIDFIAKSSKSK